MPLLELWRSNPEAVSALAVEQVIATAGDGILLDGSICAHEFREYMSDVQTLTLALYIRRCLDVSFPRSGNALQDMINQLGRRLEYDVENGVYQGSRKTIGFDGLWKSPEGHSLIVEVKTTDAYRINLDTIASYKTRLYAENRIGNKSSILIVVGRQDTGDIEAQIRGSRHAWDIRLISVDSLIKLVELKENAGEDETINKIRNLLVPFEYTRLDNIIDVVFTTAKDAEGASDDVLPEHETQVDLSGRVISKLGAATSLHSIQSKRDAIVKAIERLKKQSLIKHKRALFWSSDKTLRIACTVSRRYDRGRDYWYAYHLSWSEFLSMGTESFFVLGCLDRDVAYVLPINFISAHTHELNTTTRENGEMYWHIYLEENRDGHVCLVRAGGRGNLPLKEYELTLAPEVGS